jgi:hypothetical protein
MRQVLPLLMAFLLLLLLPRSRTFRTRWGLVGAAAVLLVLAGCGSSGPKQLTGGTPKGTSNLTVTGTAGSLTSSATVALTVD